MLPSSQKHLVSLLPETGWSANDSLIVDLTSVPRFGLRGPGSCEWLVSDGADLPDAVNRASLNDSGILAVRLGRNEALLSGCAAGRDSLAEMQRRWAAAEGRVGYDGFRQDTWAHLLISGKNAFEFLAEVSEVDYRPATMAPGHVAQTRALHLDAVIVRTDRLGTFGYELFIDRASHSFLVETLTHIDSGYQFVSADHATTVPD